MSVLSNVDEVTSAYQDVRSDTTETNWLLLEYDDKDIKLSEIGMDYDNLLAKFDETNRAFAFVRVISGDELSKRAKFVFITWIGEMVSPFKKGRMSPDGGYVKQVIKNFGVELQTSHREDLEYDRLLEAVEKAGGANYGTGE